MNPRRIGILFNKELASSGSNFFFIYALVVPIVLSLLITLVFGSLFSGKPRLGFYDEGSSKVVGILTAQSNLQTTLYPSEAALRADVEKGIVEFGFVIDKNFDAGLQNNGVSNVTTLLWGETPETDRGVVTSSFSKAVSQVAGLKSTITLTANQLGDASTTSLAARLLPLLVLIVMLAGGVLVPAASLIDEKQKRTLSALTVTPTTLLDVYTAKALVGILISVIMGVVTLLLNSAFGNQPLLLIFVLAMCALAASTLGLIVGTVVKDMNVLIGTLKVGSLVLIAPAVVEFLPQAPQWLARIFPSYYVMDPVLQIAQKGAGLGDIIGDLVILSAIIAIMLIGLALLIERQQKRLALAG